MASFDGHLQDAHVASASDDPTALEGEPDAKKLQTRDLRESPSTTGILEAPPPIDPELQVAHLVAPPVESEQVGLVGTLESKSRKKPPRRATVDSPNVCFECKTTDSKLWRRGPDGHLMCNACGLRWRRSNKAKDAPKSTPRKRKLPSATSVSPQSPQPMSLPQSSMMAARRGGLMNGSFGATSNMYAPLAAPSQNFGQLQYQPQNIYLQQQHLQAQYSQQQQQLLKKDDSQIDPALMADESLNDVRVDSSLQNMTSANASQQPYNADRDPNVDGSVTLAVQGGNLAHISQLHHQQVDQQVHQQVNPQSRDTHRPPKRNQQQQQQQQLLEQSHVDPTHMDHGDPNVMETVELQNHDTIDHNLAGDVSQHEDFSQLLSLKAFVDDAGRQF